MSTNPEAVSRETAGKPVRLVVLEADQAEPNSEIDAAGDITALALDENDLEEPDGLPVNYSWCVTMYFVLFSAAAGAAAWTYTNLHSFAGGAAFAVAVGSAFWICWKGHKYERSIGWPS